MNKIIREQLNKINFIDKSMLNDSIESITINKQEIKLDYLDNKVEIEIGRCYSLTVEKYIVNPYKGFTLHDNWNSGTHPIDIEMNAEVIQIMGKMVKVHTIGKLSNTVWDGWLPISSCKFN